MVGGGALLHLVLVVVFCFKFFSAEEKSANQSTFAFLDGFVMIRVSALDHL